MMRNETRTRAHRRSGRLPAIVVAAIEVALGMLVLSPLRAADTPAGLSKYRGIHPLWPQTGGFCYIGVSHVHNKPPTDLRVYRVLQPSNENLFVGDPVALGYDGTKAAYFGPHPLTVSGPGAPATVFCYLRGAHFHAQQPAPAASFVVKDGVSWFMGTFPPEFERDRYNVWMNDSPVLTSYQPPQVTLAQAPAGYRLPDAVKPPAAVMVPVLSPPAKVRSYGEVRNPARTITPVKTGAP